MKKSLILFLSLTCIILGATSADADTGVAGVMSLSPVGEHSCLAVSLTVEPGTIVSGIRWYNNDGETTFPNVLVFETPRYEFPDLSEAALVLEDVSGASSGWSQVLFDAPVVTSTGILHVVFVLPAYAERTGEGTGGGSGIGFHSPGLGLPSFLSADGVSWMTLGFSRSFSVEPLMSLGRSAGAPATLATIRQDRPQGWWDDLNLSQIVEDSEVLADQPLTIDERPMVVSPNPFNPRTTVAFYVSEAAAVTLDVFDIRGRRVAALLDTVVDAGRHEVVWDGNDTDRRAVASGVYFVRLQTPHAEHHKRVVLIR